MGLAERLARSEEWRAGWGDFFALLGNEGFVPVLTEEQTEFWDMIGKGRGYRAGWDAAVRQFEKDNQESWNN